MIVDPGPSRSMRRPGSRLLRVVAAVLVTGVTACSTTPRSRTGAFRTEAQGRAWRTPHVHHAAKPAQRDHWTTSVAPSTTGTAQARADTVQAAGTLFASDLGGCVKQHDPRHASRLRSHRQYDPKLWFVGRTRSGPVVRCMNDRGWHVSGAPPEVSPPQGSS